ncbi:PAS domain-containing sensor histidine kinase [Parachryseolinea silvisoli]|uniref:PAS domain-containing sensor histidine kinase n=1 Tax=Parachryseolinea silvisoli TaxID=2873601 RepID=UPI002265EC33|nr:PAS domain-containing sensor histidine kinase [Parachryseolinea silvisoli]MCD9015928.1 PAS domain S-box protein [Parachryseolinea silvisoli]
MQDLIRNLPAVIYEYAVYPDGISRFTFMSESAEPILGVSPKKVMEDASVLEAIIHEDDRPGLTASVEQSLQEGRDWHWEGRVHVRGDILWIEARANHAIEPDGTIIRRGVIQDITGRKASARETELRYLNLVERLPIGVVIHKQGKLIFANVQAHQILGARKSQGLLGTDVLNFVHPEYHPRIMRRMREVAEGMPSPMVEQQYVRMDGRVIDVETMASPFTFQGEPCVQVIFRDITERKQTEERIKKNETLLAQLFQNVPMAVVLLTETGKVEQVNKGFEEMFGFTLDELRGKSINDFIVPEELVHEGVDLNNLITSSRIVSIETIRKHRSGKLVNVILYGMPVMMENQTIGIYGVYVDFTDRKKVEEELKIRNTELDNFVYKVSHDLRAPLSSILGLVNLARLPGNTDNPMDYIDIIGEKVEHLDHFIGDVLSHSKNLKMDITTSQVDFEQIIERTFKDLNYLQGAKDMERSVKISGIAFYSDPWRISEIFRNLISNAIKYRQLNIERPEIRIKILIDQRRAEINFSDNGIGIDDVSLAKIFEMFYRATEQSDGSGIGLYIVKNAVDKLGGQINVSSQVNQGTRFSIILPNRISNIVLVNTPQAVDDQS